MRLTVVASCLCLFAGLAHADERWPEKPCKDVQDLEAFYDKNAPDPTIKAWALRPLLVLERDHCGLEVHMKFEEAEKVIQLKRWPAHVCAVLRGSKPARSLLAKELQDHCTEKTSEKEPASK